MKHPLAIAVQNGFTAALAQEVQNGDMTQGQANQVSRFALAIAQEYMKGNSVFMHKLEHFAADGEQWDHLLKANKVNLQKWGDV